MVETGVKQGSLAKVVMFMTTMLYYNEMIQLFSRIPLEPQSYAHSWATHPQIAIHSLSMYWVPVLLGTIQSLGIQG